MNATDYWPLAREYSIWNAAVATLQLWPADLEPNILSSTTEWVYATFLYTTSMHLLCNQPKEVLFGHFVTMLCDAVEKELALADKGYENGSETSNLPTPLRRTSRIHHISSDENISFNPSTPCTMATSQSNHKPVCCHLSFSHSDNEDSSTSLPLISMGFAKSPTTFITITCANSEEEDFQTLALDDEHCITHPVPNRCCAYMKIHNHIPYVVTHVHTWILLQHRTRTHWISVTFLISKMWWPPPATRISLLWKMYLDFKNQQTMVCISIYILNHTCTHIGYFYNYTFMTCLLYLMPQHLNKC